MDKNPEVWPLGESLYLTTGKSIYGKKSTSVKWIVEPSSRARFCLPFLLPREDGTLQPVLVVSSGSKPVNITITLIVVLDDSIDVAKYSVSFTDSGPPAPNPDDPVIVPLTLPKFPDDWTPEILTAVKTTFKEVASKATSVEDLQVMTTNGITNKLGAQTFLDKFLPWRNSFTVAVNKMNLKTLEDYKSVWLQVGK